LAAAISATGSGVVVQPMSVVKNSVLIMGKVCVGHSRVLLSIIMTMFLTGYIWQSSIHNYMLDMADY
jgi:hypothetical protein